MNKLITHFYSLLNRSGHRIALRTTPKLSNAALYLTCQVVKSAPGYLCLTAVHPCNVADHFKAVENVVFAVLGHEQRMNERQQLWGNGGGLEG